MLEGGNGSRFPSRLPHSAGQRNTQAAVPGPEEASGSAVDALLRLQQRDPFPAPAGLPGADVWGQADLGVQTACGARPGLDPGSLVDVYRAQVRGWDLGTVTRTLKRYVSSEAGDVPGFGAA